MSGLQYQLIPEPAYFTSNDLNRLLVFAYDNKASDITIQTGEAVIAEIEGCLHKLTQRRLTFQETSDLINHIYGANATAQVQSGTDLDTSYRVHVRGDLYYRYRINITACLFENYTGLQITMRAILSTPPDLKLMKLPTKLEQGLKIPQGVVIVSGATGSGKSTLLASVIGHFVQDPESHLKILTYESPIEYTYETLEMPSSIVSQVEIPRHLPSFAQGVRNALRRKPGLILVGEARDRETIEAVIEASLTGHPVYTTVHSNGVADTFRRMVTLFAAEERESRLYDLIETVSVVLWQALVPGVDGKRVALREFLVLNEAVKSELYKINLNDLVPCLNDLMPIHGQPIATDARLKHEAGLISDRVLARFVQ